MSAAEGRRIRHVEGRGIALRGHDVDTDRIIPARFLRAVRFDGLEEHVFEDDRLMWTGATPHPFDDPRFTGASVLVVNRNFGCGSSREHAAWALKDYGIDAVVGPSFGDIFRTNAGKNGLLAIVLPEAEVDRLMESVDLDSGSEMTVDLERCVIVAPDGREVPFAFDETTRHRILGGLDDIAITLQHEDAITAYETTHGIA